MSSAIGRELRDGQWPLDFRASWLYSMLPSDPQFGLFHPFQLLVHVFVSTQEDLARTAFLVRDGVRRDRDGRGLLRSPCGQVPTGLRRRRRRRHRAQPPYPLLPQPVLADARRRLRVVHVVHRRAPARSAQAGARTAGDHPHLSVHDLRLSPRRGVRCGHRRGPARSRPAAPRPPRPRMGSDGVGTWSRCPARITAVAARPRLRAVRRAPERPRDGQRRWVHRARRVLPTVVLSVRPAVHGQLRRQRFHRPADHVLRLDHSRCCRAVHRDETASRGACRSRHRDRRAVHRDDGTRGLRADPLAVPVHALRGDDGRAGGDGDHRPRQPSRHHAVR